jgi:hypothetical protein
MPKLVIFDHCSLKMRRAGRREYILLFARYRLKAESFYSRFCNRESKEDLSGRWYSSNRPQVSRGRPHALGGLLTPQPSKRDPAVREVELLKLGLGSPPQEPQASMPDRVAKTISPLTFGLGSPG